MFLMRLRPQSEAGFTLTIGVPMGVGFQPSVLVKKNKEIRIKKISRFNLLSNIIYLLNFNFIFIKEFLIYGK